MGTHREQPWEPDLLLLRHAAVCELEGMIERGMEPELTSLPGMAALMVRKAWERGALGRRLEDFAKRVPGIDKGKQGYGFRWESRSTLV